MPGEPVLTLLCHSSSVFSAGSSSSAQPSNINILEAFFPLSVFASFCGEVFSVHLSPVCLADPFTVCTINAWELTGPQLSSSLHAPRHTAPSCPPSVFLTWLMVLQSCRSVVIVVLRHNSSWFPLPPCQFQVSWFHTFQAIPITGAQDRPP